MCGRAELIDTCQAAFDFASRDNVRVGSCNRGSHLIVQEATRFIASKNARGASRFRVSRPNCGNVYQPCSSSRFILHDMWSAWSLECHLSSCVDVSPRCNLSAVASLWWVGVLASPLWSIPHGELQLLQSMKIEYASLEGIDKDEVCLARNPLRYDIEDVSNSSLLMLFDWTTVINWGLDDVSIARAESERFEVVKNTALYLPDL